MNPTNRTVRIKPRPAKAAPVEPEEARKTRGQIVGGWFREESFYRDITTRFLSAGLVTLTAYLGAVGLGYIGMPSGQAVTSLLWAVATGIVMAALAYALVNNRDGLAFAIASFAGAACLVGTWYGSVWFGQFTWNDGWNWIALALQLTLIFVGVAYVRRRARERRG